MRHETLNPCNDMRACVKESLLMMFTILGGGKVGDLSEDRDGRTYPYISISCSANRPEHETDIRGYRKHLDTEVRSCRLVARIREFVRGSSHEMYILGRVSECGNNLKFDLQKILGGHLGC